MMLPITSAILRPKRRRNNQAVPQALRLQTQKRPADKRCPQGLALRHEERRDYRHGHYKVIEESELVDNFDISLQFFLQNSYLVPTYFCVFNKS